MGYSKWSTFPWVSRMLVRWSFPLIEWHCKWRSYQPIVDMQVLKKGQLCSYGQLVLDILNLSSHFLCHCVTSALLITSDAFVCEDTSRDPAPCSRPWLHLFHHNHNNLSMVKIWTRNFVCSSCEWHQIKPIHSDFIQTGLCGPQQKKILWGQERANCSGLRGHHIDRLWSFGKLW